MNEEPDEEIYPVPEQISQAGEIRKARAEAHAERVDAWLAKIWPDLSRSRLQGLIGAQKLSRDGEIVNAAGDKVKPGLYVLQLPPPAPADPQPENIPVNVVFEDAHLLVIDKAVGMAMHPAPGSMTGTLVNALLAHCPASLSGVGGVARPGIVHRIDKDTSGLVVVAKNDAAHAGLAKQFAAHTLERAYFALTRGAPKPRDGEIDLALARSPDDRRKQAVTRKEGVGKRATTLYWTIETFGQLAGAPAGWPAAALVECRLKTGRTHQIRAHMAHIGAPLLGDPLYGKNRGLKIEGAGDAVERAKAAAAEFPRQALHAAILGFTHPITAHALRFEAPLPEDMRALLEILRAI